jgi:acyl dehydratase
MKFSEFQQGQILRAGPVAMDEAEIIAFAAAYDPQPFHIDVDFAKRSRWKGIIASGWQTCLIAMRLVCDGPLRGSESMGSPGLSYLKWLAPVRPGDALSLEAHVLQVSLSGSGRVGVLRWQWLLINQTEQPVLDLEATSLFDLHSPSA